MKINESGRLNGINSYQRNIESREAQHIDKKQRRKDEVSISMKAMELNAQSKVQDPERAEKVQRLKEEVESGRTRCLPNDWQINCFLIFNPITNRVNPSER